MGNLIWLASYPKSGNTWVRVFLHNLFRDGARAVALRELQGQILQSESSILWYRMLDSRPVEQWSAEDVARMRPRVHAMLAGGQAGSIFCKTHNAVMTVHGQPTVNMQVSAGAIYVVRNPLDVVLSFADFMGTTLDDAIRIMAVPNFESGGVEDHVSNVFGSWSQNVESWTGRPTPALHVVRYEDMLDDPTRVFSGVAGFLGLEPTRRRLERAVERSSFHSLSRQEDERGFRERSSHQERFFRRGTAEQWRTELTEEQVARICNDHRAQMERFNYLPEGM